MIEKIHIQNFKSIYDLELEVGRINLFIGENGSGKSNLLEALVFVSAGEDSRLDNEFLAPRGLRVPEPELMRSAFEEASGDKNIEINIIHENNYSKKYIIGNKNEPYSKWEYLNPIFENNNSTIEKFIIFSPEYKSLRTLEQEGQIQPLGVNGEGLYKLLKVVNNYKDKSYIKTIIESLQLFDWFDDIIVPDNLDFEEKKLIIKDKYLYREIDQRSTNEGFLFILFYVTLLVAKETPKAFAIDNIDSFLNPKLCTKLMTIICDLAKKYDNQIFLTTHNPAILDGIDLNDEEQKLFVVSRNDMGHTQMKRITVEDNPKDEDGESLHLSEAFMRGYLGGLPRGF